LRPVTSTLITVSYASHPVKPTYLFSNSVIFDIYLFQLLMLMHLLISGWN